MTQAVQIATHTMDKSTWSEGPWMDEPDQIRWDDESTKLPCLIFRGELGQLNGYVGVQKHPYYNLPYDDAKIEALQVHFGVNLAGTHSEYGDIWWFGFDCAHYTDVIPKLLASMKSSFPDAVYRDIEYVTKQCEQLAQQLLSQQKLITANLAAPLK